MMTTAMEKYWLGVVLEFSYHMIFTNYSIYDPAPEVCLCELYDICVADGVGA